jgi:hypothetical protein
MVDARGAILGHEEETTKLKNWKIDEAIILVLDYQCLKSNF